jgi:hypothetical protein
LIATEVILLGEVLAAGGTVRIRPLDGGGNETQVQAPAGGRFYVKGLENGDYEAVDELGARRVFSVSEGPGEEVTLETFPDADAPEGQELPPNYGTEAEPVADESHVIQHGKAPMSVVEGTAILEREGSERASDLNPPTVPGPDTPAGVPTPPSAEVTQETVGNSSDADAEREPGEVSLETGDPAAHAGAALAMVIRRPSRRSRCWTAATFRRRTIRSTRSRWWLCRRARRSFGLACRPIGRSSRRGVIASSTIAAT